MAETVIPRFNITRPQIAAFVNDPRTIFDIEALIRLLRDDVPALLGTKVDETRQINTDSTLTGGGDLSADRTLGVELTSEAERIRDVIAEALTDSASIAFTPNDGADTITAVITDTSVTPGSYGDSTHVGQFTVDQQGRITGAANVAIALPAGYTDEQAQDAVGTILTDTATIDFTYNDGANTITADVNSNVIRRLSVATVSGTSRTLASGDIWGHLRFTNSAAITLTVDTTHGFNSGDRARFTAAGTGQVTMSPTGVTLNSRGGALKSAGQHAVWELECVGTNEFDVLGDVTA